MMTTPAVSIITPVFNGSAWLGETVRSVLAQTFTSWEHIFIDDGSSDGSVRAIEEACDPQRTRIIRHERNLGIPAARNTGLKSATGRYVALLDQDDLWVASKLEKQMGILEKGFRFCFGKHAFFVKEGDSVRIFPAGYPVHQERIEDLDGKRLYSRLFRDNFIGAGSVIAERSLLTEAAGFDESIRGGGDDYDLWLRLAGMTSFSMLRETVLFSRMHSANYTDTVRMTDDVLRILQTTAAGAGMDERSRSARFGAIHYKRFRSYFAGKDYPAAAEALRMSAEYAGHGPRLALASALVRMRGTGRGIFFGSRRLVESTRRMRGGPPAGIKIPAESFRRTLRGEEAV
ncbi:MAG TPA: glycosyltransferase [Candidatus Krumholzibacterium sp.]|nr:glycosyltransferase [Candidatus Krumholzibacterium sp.]